jgi:hypothetical protein
MPFPTVDNKRGTCLCHRRFVGRDLGAHSGTRFSSAWWRVSQELPLSPEKRGFRKAKTQLLDTYSLASIVAARL